MGMVSTECILEALGGAVELQRHCARRAVLVLHQLDLCGVLVARLGLAPRLAPQQADHVGRLFDAAAAVLGVVGAGGLGQLLSFHMGLFHMGKTATILGAMLVLVAAVDALSYGARRLATR